MSKNLTIQKLLTFKGFGCRLKNSDFICVPWDVHMNWSWSTKSISGRQHSGADIGTVSSHHLNSLLPHVLAEQLFLQTFFYRLHPAMFRPLSKPPYYHIVPSGTILQIDYLLLEFSHFITRGFTSHILLCVSHSNFSIVETFLQVNLPLLLSQFVALQASPTCPILILEFSLVRPSLPTKHPISPQSPCPSTSLLCFYLSLTVTSLLFLFHSCKDLITFMGIGKLVTVKRSLFH